MITVIGNSPLAITKDLSVLLQLSPERSHILLSELYFSPQMTPFPIHYPGNKIFSPLFAAFGVFFAHISHYVKGEIKSNNVSSPYLWRSMTG